MKYTACFIIILISSKALFAAQTMNVLVYPFKNIKGSEWSWVSAGMTNTVISDLNRVRDMSVFSEEDRHKAIKELIQVKKLKQLGIMGGEDIEMLGENMGANVIFTGEYQILGKRIVVWARLIDVRAHRTLKTLQIEGTIDPLENIFELQRKIVFNLLAETEKLNLSDIKKVTIKNKEKEEIIKRKDPKPEAYKLYCLGYEVQYTNPKKALELYHKATQIDSEYIAPIIMAGWTYFVYNKYDDAMSLYTKAQDMLDHSNQKNTKDYALIMNNIGSVHNDKGQYDKALEYYHKAQSIDNRLGLQNTNAYAAIMNNNGVVYDRKGQHDKALEYFLKALSIRDKLGLQNTNEYASNLINAGWAHCMKGQYDKALEYLLKSQSILDKIGFQNTNYSASTLNGFGAVYYMKGQYDKALEYFLKAQSLYDKLGFQNTNGNAQTTNNIGRVYNMKCQYDRALEYYLKAQSIFDKLGLRNTDYITTMNNLGLLYYEKFHNPCKAALYMEACVTIQKKIKHADYDKTRIYLETIKKACKK